MLDKFSLYPNTKYTPTNLGITVLYDDNYVYLSIKSSHIYGKKIYEIFDKYYSN